MFVKLSLQAADDQTAPSEDIAQWIEQAAAYESQGRFSDALLAYDRAVSLAPHNAHAQAGRGDVLQQMGQMQEAIAAYDVALSLNPGSGHVLSNRATALQTLSHLDEALVCHDCAVALLPNSAEAQFARANCLRALGRACEALAAYDAALALRMDYPQAWSNRGNTLLDLGRVAEALAAHDRALAFTPGHARFHVNRANALREAGAWDAAFEGYEKAIALQPSLAEAHWNRGLTRLLLGNFHEGWRDYEWRTQIANPVGNRNVPIQRWQGQDLAGKTLFVHWEQGLGDTIQFCRYLPVLQQRGARIVFAPQPKLKRLMGGLGVKIVNLDDRDLAADYHVPLLSLPLIMATDLSSIPASVPYLFSESTRRSIWKARLGGGTGLKIGISWQGAVGAMDIGRSLPLNAFAPIAALPHVRLFSLHRGEGERQLAMLPQVTHFEDLDDGPDAFMDTAALIEELDLVITSDTAVAHLAGALGAPVWLAIKSVPEWRWLLSREDSPWYPTMRLFRQAKAGDWTYAFAKICSALQDLISRL